MGFRESCIFWSWAASSVLRSLCYSSKSLHDLLQNRNILGYLFRIRLILLNQAVYLLQGVRKVHVGEAGLPQSSPLL